MPLVGSPEKSGPDQQFDELGQLRISDKRKAGPAAAPSWPRPKFDLDQVKSTWARCFFAGRRAGSGKNCPRSDFRFFLPKFLFVFSSFSAQISTKFHRNSREIRQICVKITVLMGRNFEFQEKVPKSRKSFYETCQSCVLKSVSGSRNFEFRGVEPKSHRNFRLAPTLPNLGKNFAKV